MKAKRMPVKKVKLDGENLWLAGRNNKLELAMELYNKPRTNVIVHHSALEEVPLDTRCGVKTARMVENPFIRAMREKWENQTKT